MAELIGDIFRGDSWDFPGGKDTQILHTNSEDVSSDSPTQAKVEEQSSHKKPSVSERFRRTGASKLAEAGSTTQEDTKTAALAELAQNSSRNAVVSQMPTNLTLSNSSNSSASCLPQVSTQAGPSYDISASAQAAEQLLHNSRLPAANMPQAASAAQTHPFLQPQNILPNSVMQRLMASVFDDVDSGRHHAEDNTAHPGHSQFRGQRNSPMAQDSLPSVFRQFFPEDDHSPLLLQQQQQQHQQQLRELQLSLLPPQLRDPQHQPAPAHQQGNLLGLSSLQQPAPNGMSTQAMPADLQQQWSGSISQLASPSGAAQSRQRGTFAAANPHIKLEDLDLGVKRDFNSFTGPSASSRQSRPASMPRRALSFTGGSAISAASTAAHVDSAGRRVQANSGQAASHSRLASPVSNMTSPPDTDASISDSEELSGSDGGGSNTKRRRVVKGKRGSGRRPRRMVCKNCGAHQTPQWRCGPEGPRTLCNACGVRYKKGLPLTGAVRDLSNAS